MWASEEVDCDNITYSLCPFSQVQKLNKSVNKTIVERKNAQPETVPPTEGGIPTQKEIEELSDIAFDGMMMSTAQATQLWEVQPQIRLAKPWIKDTY